MDMFDAFTPDNHLVVLLYLKGEKAWKSEVIQVSSF